MLQNCYPSLDVSVKRTPDFHTNTDMIFGDNKTNE